VYLAYVDESGDPGERGTYAFSLGCVLMRDDRWLGVLDEMVAYRRWLRDRFGVPVRAELKANKVIRGKGELQPLMLPDTVRRRIFRTQLSIQSRLPVRTFAVVIDKPSHYARVAGDGSPERRAWEYLLQRLERLSYYEDVGVMLVHDQGSDALIRALARKWRRFGSAGSRFGTGPLLRPFRHLVDDPVPRDSSQSYMLQLADFAAYAAFRKVYPPTGRTYLTRVASADAWDLIGPARHLLVSARRDGIVVWP
jgi:hypothetical protein